LDRLLELGHGFGGCLPAEGLAWPAVEGVRNGVEIVSGVSRQIGALREVLAKQSVGVLVGSSLPRALGVTEVDGQPCVDGQLGVLGDL
jgi:hypothetical protein